MLTQNIFKEHKSDYTIYRQETGLDHYGNAKNTFSAGGTVNCMWLPVSDEASIQTYGQSVVSMRQAVIYDETEIDEHDQVHIDGGKYEIISIKNYPSYRLLVAKFISKITNTLGTGTLGAMTLD